MPRTDIGVPVSGPFWTRKIRFAFDERTFKIRLQERPGILAQIDDPVLAALSVGDEEPVPGSSTASTVSRETSSTRRPQRSMSMNMALSRAPRNDGKELLHLVVLEVPGQRLRQTDRYLRDRIVHLHPLVVDEVVEEEPDASGDGR